MPIVRLGGLDVGYDLVGSGPPLLCLMGLGTNRRAWLLQVPTLSRALTLVLPDNRGVGESSKPPGPYSVRLLAEDARALLDFLGIERAHVLGVSMGGLIAQELALAHPGRVRSLILACTFPKASRGMRDLVGRTHASLSDRDGALAADARSIAEAMMPFVFGGEFWASAEEAIRRGFVEAFSAGFSMQGFLGQLAAVLEHDAQGRLADLAVPTLVLHGALNRLVPYHHGERLAAAIPGAELRTFPRGTHAFFVEHADAFNREVLGWVHDLEAEGRPEAPVAIPIEDALDLHTFRPAEVGDLVHEYLRAARERGLTEVRIIHGKGTGALRRSVHALLERDPEVVEFTICNEEAGGWGATRVRLASEPGLESKLKLARLTIRRLRCQ